MSSYDYDAPVRERTSKRYYHEERRDSRDPRYDPRDNYLSPVSHDLIPRPREDSDLSVEEIHRDFPPPGYSNRDIRRARSAGAGYYDDHDDRRYHNDRDRHYEPRSSRKAETSYYEAEQKKTARMLTKQEQIIAALTGAAIAIGGKELYDRRDAKQHDSEVQRNVLTSAALGAAGALAGYQGTEFYNKRKEKDERKLGYTAHRGRDDSSGDEEDGKEKKSHKNFLEGALAAAGLGGALKALTGGSAKDDKSDTKSRRGSDSGSKGGKGEGSNKIQKAAMASLIAGATEAFRVSKEPGSWKGEKAKRILTAAAGAATIDAAQKEGGSKRGLAESVIGGLVSNRVINGSKKNIEVDEKTGRSRSRSRARSKSRDGGGGGGGVSGLAALATAGLGALGAKKIMDNRERSRSRRRSADSNDSRGGSPGKRHRSRSRSVVDKARRGLAKFGLAKEPEEEDDRDNDRRDRSRRDYDDYDDHKSSRRRRDSYDDYDRDRDHRKSSRRDDYDDDDDDEDRSHHKRDRSRQRGERGAVARRGSASSTDLGDTDEDEKHGKKMRGPPKADRYGDGPRYSDGNPYAALPPPPRARSDKG